MQPRSSSHSGVSCAPRRPTIARAPALLAMVLLFFTVPARAAQRAGVQMADTMTIGGQGLVLNGLGIRQATIFRVNVYVAGLYVGHRSSDPAVLLRGDEPKVLHLVFVRDVDREKMVEAWQEGFDKNAGVRKPAMQSRIDRLGGWMIDLKNGNTLTFAYLPARGIEVKVNGVAKGMLEGQDFAEVFFSIWLGPNPPNAALRSGLLGRE